MKYKVGDCFYVKNRQLFSVVDKIIDQEGYKLRFEYPDGSLYPFNTYFNFSEHNLLRYISGKSLIPLLEDSEKERLAAILKY